jgi:hypothetical protein
LVLFYKKEPLASAPQARKRFFLQKEAKTLIPYPEERIAIAAAAARFSTPSLL